MDILLSSLFSASLDSLAAYERKERGEKVSIFYVSFIFFLLARVYSYSISRSDGSANLTIMYFCTWSKNKKRIARQQTAQHYKIYYSNGFVSFVRSIPSTYQQRYSRRNVKKIGEMRNVKKAKNWHMRVARCVIEVPEKWEIINFSSTKPLKRQQKEWNKAKLILRDCVISFIPTDESKM